MLEEQFYTIRSMAFKLNVPEEKLQLLFNHNYFSALTEMDGIPVFSPSTLDNLKENFEKFYKDLEEKLTVDIADVKKENKDLNEEISEHSKEERSMEDDFVSEDEIEEVEEKQISEEVTPDEIDAPDENTEPQKKKKKKRKTSSFLDGPQKTSESQITGNFTNYQEGKYNGQGINFSSNTNYQSEKYNNQGINFPSDNNYQTQQNIQSNTKTDNFSTQTTNSSSPHQITKEIQQSMPNSDWTSMEQERRDGKIEIDVHQQLEKGKRYEEAYSIGQQDFSSKKIIKIDSRDTSAYTAQDFNKKVYSVSGNYNNTLEHVVKESLSFNGTGTCAVASLASFVKSEESKRFDFNQVEKEKDRQAFKDKVINKAIDEYQLKSDFQNTKQNDFLKKVVNESATQQSAFANNIFKKQIQENETSNSTPLNVADEVHSTKQVSILKCFQQTEESKSFDFQQLERERNKEFYKDKIQTLALADYTLKTSKPIVDGTFVKTKVKMDDIKTMKDIMNKIRENQSVPVNDSNIYKSLNIETGKYDKNYKNKLNIHFSGSLFQTIGSSFCMSVIGGTDFGKTYLYMSKFTQAPAASLRKVANKAQISDFVIKNQKTFKETKHLFEDNKIFGLKDIDALTNKNYKKFTRATSEYFLKVHGVNLNTLNKDGLKNLRKNLTDTEKKLLRVWKKENRLGNLRFSKKLSFSAWKRVAIRAIDETDFYQGGKMVITGYNVARNTIKTSRKVLHPVAKKVAVASYKKLEKTVPALASFTEAQKAKQAKKVAEKLKKKAQRKEVAKRKRVAATNFIKKTRVGKTTAAIGLRVKRVTSFLKGNKLTKATSKLFKLGAKAIGSVISFVGKVKLIAICIIGGLFALYFLLSIATNMISTLLQGISGSFIINLVPSGLVEKYIGSDDRTEEEKNGAMVSELLNTYYNKTVQWEKDVKEETLMKTPRMVAEELGNVTLIQGGDDPEHPGKKYMITKWGSSFNSGITMNYYDGNSLAVDGDGKTYFAEAQNLSLFDPTAITRSILAISNVQYQTFLYQNSKYNNVKNRTSGDIKQVNVETFAEDLFEHCKATKDEISEIYQCSGCKTLSNYSCTNQKLAGLKNAYGSPYNFLTKDDKGKIDNHNGEGCTFYQCTAERQSWWKTKDGTKISHTKYGCEHKTGYQQVCISQINNKIDGMDDRYYNGVYYTIDDLKKVPSDFFGDSKTNDDTDSDSDDDKKKDTDILEESPYNLLIKELKSKNIGVMDLKTLKSTYGYNAGDKITSILFKNKGLTQPYEDKKYTAINSKKYHYIASKPTIEGIQFAYNGKIFIKFSYQMNYCRGHYGCPGNHSKKYCPGHADLTVNVATATMSYLEKNDHKMFAFSSYGKPGKFFVNNADDASTFGKVDTMWDGWGDYNRDWAYQLFNQDWDELNFGSVGLADLSSSNITAGEYDEEELFSITSSGTNSYATDVGEAAAKYAVSKNGCIYSQEKRESSGYYDCSSLCYRAYRETGANFWTSKSSLTASGEMEYIKTRHKKSTYVLWEKSKNTAAEIDSALALCQDGDLIFTYDGTKGKTASHVIMYCKNLPEAKGNMFIEAGSSTTGVHLTKNLSALRRQQLVMIGRPYYTPVLSGTNKKIGYAMNVPTPPKNVITYMSYTAFSSPAVFGYATEQWRLQYTENTWTEKNGAMKYARYTDCEDEKDADGNPTRRYHIAMGSFYTQNIGDKFDITFKNASGEKVVLKCIIGDQKSDQHTNVTHQYHAEDYSIVEIIYDGALVDEATYRSHKNSQTNVPKNSQVVKIVYQGRYTKYKKKTLLTKANGYNTTETKDTKKK